MDKHVYYITVLENWVHLLASAAVCRGRSNFLCKFHEIAWNVPATEPNDIRFDKWNDSTSSLQ